MRTDAMVAIWIIVAAVCLRAVRVWVVNSREAACAVRCTF